MSGEASPRLGLPYLAAAQPASPADGTLYILPGAAAGSAWAGQPKGAVMHFEAGGWAPLAVGEGHLAWVKDEGQAVVWDGAAWGKFPAVTATPASRALVASPGGASIGVEVREEEVTVSGSTIATSIVIRSRGVVLAVSTRTTQAVTGASSYSCGISGEAGKSGSSLGVALNSSNIGVVGPTAFYSDTPVVLIAPGPAFTGGKVNVVIQLLTFGAPNAV
jgi:hypothetical protein